MVKTLPRTIFAIEIITESRKNLLKFNWPQSRKKFTEQQGKTKWTPKGHSHQQTPDADTGKVTMNSLELHIRDTFLEDEWVSKVTQFSISVSVWVSVNEPSKHL